MVFIKKRKFQKNVILFFCSNIYVCLFTMPNINIFLLLNVLIIVGVDFIIKQFIIHSMLLVKIMYYPLYRQIFNDYN